eukprot:14770684-Alexandrium_andersonii.AAC.1
MTDAHGADRRARVGNTSFWECPHFDAIRHEAWQGACPSTDGMPRPLASDCLLPAMCHESGGA